MPGVMPMKASISSGLRRWSLVRSAALRSGLATIVLDLLRRQRLCVSGCAEAVALDASASEDGQPEFHAYLPSGESTCPVRGIAHQRRFIVQQLFERRAARSRGAPLLPSA